MVEASVRQIYAAYSGDNPDYSKLARVLKASAEHHNPDWSVTVEHTYKGVQSRYEGFRRKALNWWRAVRGADDGAEIALLDCDTLVRGSLDTVFNAGGPFDLAVTRRQGARFPISSGVIFVRKSAETQLFLERWMRRTAKLYHSDKRFCDQIALRDLLAEDHGLEVLELPCSVWNCEQHSWSRFHDDTRIAHITSHIRRHLFKGEPIVPGSEPIVEAWRQAEAALVTSNTEPPSSEAPDTEPPSSGPAVVYETTGDTFPSSDDAADEPWVPWLQRDEGAD